MKPSYLLTIAALLAGTTFLPAIAEEPHPAANGAEAPAPEKTTRQDVRKEIREAIESIKSYSADKREEGVKKAKAALDDFDSRMEKLEADTKEKKDKAVAKLKEKRQEVAERYNELKQATKENWEKAKAHFLEEYREMEEEYEEKVDPFLAKRN